MILKKKNTKVVPNYFSGVLLLTRVLVNNGGRSYLVLFSGYGLLF